MRTLWAYFYKKFSFSILLIKKCIIINFSLYSLMSLNQKTMEYGQVCHLILYQITFFLIVQLTQVSLLIRTKWNQLGKSSYRKISFSKLTILTQLNK